MFNSFIGRAAFALAALVTSASAWAGASREEAQAQVAAAVSHVKKVGAEQATKDFNTAADWKVKGMNVIYQTIDGKVLASSLNERLIGKETLSLKDPSGKEFVKEFVSTVRGPKGEGWVDYQFINPESKKLEERSMYVRRVAGEETFIGVAITK